MTEYPGSFVILVSQHWEKLRHASIILTSHSLSNNLPLEASAAFCFGFCDGGAFWLVDVALLVPVEVGVGYFAAGSSDTIGVDVTLLLCES